MLKKLRGKKAEQGEAMPDPSTEEGRGDILRQLLENQRTVLAQQAAISEKLEKLERLLNAVLGNTVTLYGKAVLNRLNFIELSEGKPISLSSNEQEELAKADLHILKTLRKKNDALH